MTSYGSIEKFSIFLLMHRCKLVFVIKPAICLIIQKMRLGVWIEYLVVDHGGDEVLGI
jgi:hypothetical protein